MEPVLVDPHIVGFEQENAIRRVRELTGAGPEEAEETVRLRFQGLRTVRPNDFAWNGFPCRNYLDREFTFVAATVADLVGEVASVYDFLRTPSRPPDAVAVLVRHLDTRHLRNVREGVIRALGVPSARPLAFEALRAAYRTERDTTLRLVIANALAGMARFEEVRELPGIEEYLKLFS